MDVAGLVKGASRGEGLGNKFLGTARECDCLCHVLRAFEDAGGEGGAGDGGGGVHDVCVHTSRLS